VRLHVVSDVHGAADTLEAAGRGADALICLGDLILFLDYDDPGRGIFADLFGAEAASELIRLRTARRFDEARALSGRLWSRFGDERGTVIERAINEQYAALFAVLPDPSYLTYGNVDLPRLWPPFLRPGLHVLDGQRTDIDGYSFGFVGGGLRTPMRTPFEMDEDAYAAKVAAVGAVD
jgi:Icc-related predicted phosphoesterase